MENEVYYAVYYNGGSIDLTPDEYVKLLQEGKFSTSNTNDHINPLLLKRINSLDNITKVVLVTINTIYNK